MAKANQWFQEGVTGNTFRKRNYKKIPIEEREYNKVKWELIK